MFDRFTLGHMVPKLISPGVANVSVQLGLVIKSFTSTTDGPRNIGSMWDSADKFEARKGSPNQI